MLKVFEKSYAIYILYTMYLLILSGLYYLYLAPLWSYMGFYWIPDTDNIIISGLVFTFFLILTPKSSNTRALFCNLLFAIYVIPSLVVFSFRGFELGSAIVVWSAVLVVYAVSSLKIHAFQFGEISGPKLLGYIAIFTGISIVLFAAFGGLSNFNLDLSRVYDFRDEAADGMPAIFAYLSSMVSKVLIPFGVVLSLFYKQRLLVWFFLICAILVFGMTSHKSVVAFALVAAAFFVFLRAGGNFGVVLAGLVFASGASLISIYAADGIASDGFGSWFTSLFVRRSLMAPPLLDFYYLDFFRENRLFFWSDSRLTLDLVRNPYGQSMPYVIGLLYFNDATLGANTGFIGSGYGQAGLFGTFFYSTLVGMVISFLNSSGKRISPEIVFPGMLGIVLTMFSSADFVTTILNHGLLLAIVIISMTQSKSSRQPAMTAAPLQAS